MMNNVFHTGFPILIVHSGTSPSLEICLRQALKMNPTGRIILLGDAPESPYDFVEYHSFLEPELYRDVKRFQDLYVHFSSSSSPEWERFCMTRWLVVRNFMQKENLTRCLAMDSDVLLFCEAAQEAERFSSAAMTFAHWNAKENLIHCCFIQNRQALESFTQYLFDVYETPEILERVKENSRKKNHHLRVSDMTLFYDWSVHSPFSFAFFEDYYLEGIFFDSCIDFTKDFQSVSYFPGVFRRFKKIFWKDGIPYAVLKSGQKAPMKAIHYHGGLKFLMLYHFQKKSPFFRIFWNFFLQKTRSLSQKLKRLLTCAPR